MDNEKIYVSLFLERELGDQLVAEAQAQHRSVAAHVRWIISQHFNAQEGKQ